MKMIITLTGHVTDPVKRFSALSIIQKNFGSFEGTVFERKEKNLLRIPLKALFPDFTVFRVSFIDFSQTLPSK